ncbi:MAG TPA: hypothetical protein VNT30_11065 [Stellaceae bacterium]|nr:hypothetical protein [Stellaceae bacterium]
MGDTWIIFIPEDPLLVLPPNRIAAAIDVLKTLRWRADPLELLERLPDFIWCGPEWLTAIRCPCCGAEVKDWWLDEIGRWYERDHRLLAVEMPCCHNQMSLNDLDYDRPQGFASSGIEIHNPGGDVEPWEVERITEAIGTPIRVIWRHL